MRGYDKGCFSFNVKGGDDVKPVNRCISNRFLPDADVPCEQGVDNPETLEVKYR